MKIAVYGGVVYLTLNLLALFASDWLLFVPQPSSYAQLPHQVRIPTTDGETLNAVYLEQTNAPFTILFSHGNAEDLGNVVPFMRQFSDRGYSVLMYDYRGYGTSEGTPSYRKVCDDADAVYRWLTAERGIPPEQIVAHGRSLGGALAMRIASRHKVGGLIMECSFVSAFRVKTQHPLLPWDKFNSIKSMASVDCPVLIVHGTDDEIIPIWHGKALFETAPEPKQHFWIEGGRHNDYAYVAGNAYPEAIAVFLENLGYPTKTPK